MSRSGQKLEGTVPEKQLKTAKDALKQGALMSDKMNTIINVLIAGFTAVVASNALGGLLGGRGLKGLFKGGKGWKAAAGGLGATKAMSKARGVKGPISKATGRPDMRYKANKKTVEAATKHSDDMLKASKKIVGNSKVQKKVIKAGTKTLGKSIPALNAVMIGGELVYNVHKEGLAEGVKTTARDNKYALAAAAGGGILGSVVPGAGTAAGAGIGFLVGTGLDILSSFTGGWAKGGTVPRSGIGLVGERGPELISMSAGTQVVPNHYLGGFADGQFGMVDMKETNELLTQTIGLLSSVAVNTQGAADGIKNINIRTG
jgi:hypothetical protein